MILYIKVYLLLITFPQTVSALLFKTQRCHKPLRVAVFEHAVLTHLWSAYPDRHVLILLFFIIVSCSLL